MAVPSPRRTVFMLALCQALGMTGMSILATVSAIVGNMLASDKALSTLPVALQMTGMMCATVPAALLMARIGRRGGFWTGSAATPIAMIGCGFEFTAAAFVIQWHILGMYAPSFCTGHLIARFGVGNVLTWGVALLFACCAINLAGIGEANFWAANMLLGIGWNFSFVGATTLLTRTYTQEERAKVQAFNDFTIFGTSTLSSFSSGALLAEFGWTTVQVAVLPAVAIAATAILWLRLQARRAEPQYAGL